MMALAYRYLLVYSIVDLKSRKVRTILTLFSIAIGISFLLVLSNITISLRSQVETEIKSLVGSAIVAMDRDGLPVPVFVINEISKVNGVREAVPIVFGIGSHGSQPVVVFGLEVRKIPSFVTLVEGVLPSSDSSTEVLLTEASRGKLSARLNGTINILTPARAFGTELKVVGMCEAASILQGIAAGGTPVAVAGLQTAQDMLNLNGYCNLMIIRISDPLIADALSESIRKSFPRLSVSTEKDLLRGLGNILNTMDVLFLSISSISLTVAGLGTMNSVATSVREKTREIGILKSMGAEGHHIIFIFMLQGIFLGVLGGLLGIAGGYVATYYVEKYYLPSLFLRQVVRLPFTFSPEVALRGMVASLIVSSLSSAFPSWKATTVRPIEALRFE